jgi:hypothetical protein
VHRTERTRHRLGRGQDHLVARGLRLQLRQRVLQVRERVLRVRRQFRSARALDLVKRSHRLRDWRREVEQVRRHVRVALQRVEATRERLACGSG